MSQAVSGFEAGKTYQLTYRENSRGNTSARPEVGVTLDGVTIVPRHFVDKLGTYATVTSEPFTYSGSSGTATLAVTNYTTITSAANDNTALWDNFQFAEVVPEPASLGLLGGAGLGLLARRRRTA